MNKLARWVDERKTLLEMQIGEMDRAIREAKATARLAGSLETKVDSQRHIKVLEAKRNDMRKRLFKAQDKIEENKDQLLNGIEVALHQRVQEEEHFYVGLVLKCFKKIGWRHHDHKVKYY